MSRGEPGEASIAAFDGHPIAHVRRPWSEWLSQFDEVIRQRGAAALPFPAADAEFRTALRDLALSVAAMEGVGVSFRPAGLFVLRPDLVDALVALRCEISRAYNAARNKDGDVIVLGRRAQRDLKTVLTRIKTAWPYGEEKRAHAACPETPGR